MWTHFPFLPLHLTPDVEFRLERGSSLSPISELIDEIDFPLTDFFRAAIPASEPQKADAGRFFSHIYYYNARVSRAGPRVVLEMRGGEIR